jgi:Zn-dependent peptidase ImmA (M78 family)/plasmid maintenance system antidote protein VapI
MLSEFNADMLIVARQARGFSQSSLARAAGVSQSKVSKIENGFMPLTAELASILANVLKFRTEFFRRQTRLRSAPANYHRKREKLSVGDWEAILARSEIFRFSIDEMLSSVEMVATKPAPPAIDIDQFDGRIEDVAMAVRQQWMLPRGPILDVTRVLEDAGVLIVPFDFGTELIDAFCQHATDGLPPLIFQNTRFKAKDRVRFSLAHELAHLVMHRLPNPRQEDQANNFASAFLMPASDILPSLHGMSLEKLMTLKLYWKTSMQAIIRRARDLGKVSERGYKYYMIEMGSRGWRAKEPVEIASDIERPLTLAQLFRTHLGILSYSLDDLSSLFGIMPDELVEMYPATAPDRRKLKLVT